jgi:hypothetical protein
MCCTVYYTKCPMEHLPHFRQLVFSGLFWVTNLTWVRSLTIMQILPIPVEYPYQYWDSLLMPYIHVHQFLGNLSSVIMVRKLPCVRLFTRRTTHTVSDYEYIFHKWGICGHVFQCYGNCWIELGELNAWPPHLPDLTLTFGDIWRSWCTRRNHRQRWSVMGHPEFCCC